jgi:hypothetical protein
MADWPPNQTVLNHFPRVGAYSASREEIEAAPPLRSVRGAAGLQDGVTHVVFEGADGFRTVYLLDDALSDDVLLADHLDGAPLDFDHGAPLRIVSPPRDTARLTAASCSRS